MYIPCSVGGPNQPVLIIVENLKIQIFRSKYSIVFTIAGKHSNQLYLGRQIETIIKE